METTNQYQTTHLMQSQRRTGRRLRHLVGISGRLIMSSSDQAILFTLAIPSPESDDAWSVIYTSEPISSTVNPEWRPLPQHIYQTQTSCSLPTATKIKLDIYTSPITTSTPTCGKTCRASCILSLDELETFGNDLSRAPSPMYPNSLILEFSDGEYSLFPPPLQRSTANMKAPATTWLLPTKQTTNSTYSSPYISPRNTYVAASHDNGGNDDYKDISLTALQLIESDMPLTATTLATATRSLHTNNNTTNNTKNTTNTSTRHARSISDISTGNTKSMTPPQSGTITPKSTTTSMNTMSTTQGLGRKIMSTLVATSTLLPSSTAMNTAANLNGDTNPNPHQHQPFPSLVARRICINDMRKNIANIIQAQRRIKELSALCVHAKSAVDDCLATNYGCPDAPRSQRQCLEALHITAREMQRKHAVLQHRREQAAHQTENERKNIIARGQALVTTLQALQTAFKKVNEAQKALHGEEGCGRLDTTMKELVLRRSVMVVQAGEIYTLGPMMWRGSISSVSGVAGERLDDQFDVLWAGGKTNSETNGGTGVTDNTTNTGSRRNSTSNSIALDTSKTTTSITTTNTVGDDYMRLSIRNMTLDSSVWRHAFDPEGYAWDPSRDRSASIALGYAAHLVDRLAFYLGVPLRYPIKFRGSSSVIVDNHPPSGEWNEEREEMYRKEQMKAFSMETGTSTSMNRTADTPGSITSYLFGGTSGRTAGKVVDTLRVRIVPVEYPLYCESNRERPRFAVGVFLLNKNVIQLLQMHGMSAFGPNQLLQNLYKLIAAGRSGIPPGFEKEYTFFGRV